MLLINGHWPSPSCPATRAVSRWQDVRRELPADEQPHRGGEHPVLVSQSRRSYRVGEDDQSLRRRLRCHRRQRRRPLQGPRRGAQPTRPPFASRRRRQPRRHLETKGFFSLFFFYILIWRRPYFVLI